MFKIKQAKFGGYYIVMKCNQLINEYSFLGSIAIHLNVKINNFHNAIKLYNGTCIDLNNNLIDFATKYARIYFKNKDDANLFITEYLEPQLTAKELSK